MPEAVSPVASSVSRSPASYVGRGPASVHTEGEVQQVAADGQGAQDRDRRGGQTAQRAGGVVGGGGADERAQLGHPGGDRFVSGVGEAAQRVVEHHGLPPLVSHAAAVNAFLRRGAAHRGHHGGDLRQGERRTARAAGYGDRAGEAGKRRTGPGWLTPSAAWPAP